MLAGLHKLRAAGICGLMLVSPAAAPAGNCALHTLETLLDAGACIAQRDRRLRSVLDYAPDGSQVSLGCCKHTLWQSTWSDVWHDAAPSYI